MDMSGRKNTLPGEDNYCEDCGGPLRESPPEKEMVKRLKRCPNCSGFANHHVYRRNPEEFGVTPGRVTTPTPTGDQSWCHVCRKLNRPHWTGRRNEAAFVRCGEVPTMEFALTPPTPPTVRRKNKK
jgi:hypothetical protein